MNTYVLKIMREIFIITLTYIGTIFNLSVDTKNIDNMDKSLMYVTEVDKYDTIYKYDKSLPSDMSSVINKGSDGYYYIDRTGNKVVLKNKEDEVVVKGSGDVGYYKGWTTGYGADCSTCSGVGNVACYINGKPYNLLKDGVYYNDKEYGKVRIIAATKELFPCGTIIKIDNKKQEPFYGIVLDRGYGMEYQYNNYNIVHLDIAFQSEKDSDIYSVFNTKLTAEFKVYRYGF